jgi:hypothetical protein
MAVVNTRRATSAAELRQIDRTHDAYFDPDAIRFDPDTRVLSIPFDQEALPDDELVPKSEVVKVTRRGRVERVPFLKCVLELHGVESWALGSDGRDEPGMLMGIEWNAGEGEVRVGTVTGPLISATVNALDVEIVVTDEVALVVERRHGRWWVSDTTRNAARGERVYRSPPS